MATKRYNCFIFLPQTQKVHLLVGCYDRAKWVWPHWVTRRNFGQGFNLPDLPLEPGAAGSQDEYLSLWSFATQVALLFDSVFPSSPAALQSYLFITLFFCLRSVFILSVFPFPPSFICLLVKPLLSTLACGKGSGQSPVCVINQSFLGETEADLFFLAGLRVCLLFCSCCLPTFFLPFSSSVPRCSPPFAQRSRFPPSGLGSCQRCGGFFSNPQSARAPCRKSTLVPSIIYEICCTLFP